MTASRDTRDRPEASDLWLNPDDVDWFWELGRTVRAVMPLRPLPLAAAAGGELVQPLPELHAPLRLPSRPRDRPPPPASRRPLATRLAPVAAALAAAGLGVPLFLAARQAEVAAPAFPAARTAAGQPVRAESASPPPAAQQEAAPAPAQLAPVQAGSAPLTSPPVAAAEPAPEKPSFPAVHWRESTAVGVPHAGSLEAGVKLPREGPDWVTWDPVRDRVPNRANRLYGTDELVRLAINVIASYRLAHPDAPRVVVGDLSRRGGGEIDEHASHENGLDMDVYYPRKDGRELAPATVSQVDVRLAQDLLDRFVAAGASMVFVGYSVPLHGEPGVVVPWPGHNEHLHVRIGATGAGSGD